MGGDHKCPLCSATFTRPQHVGRHLRAHTGDRPYECKECPLRFARSDLLSRHVNKAHPKPNGQHGSHKNEKKGRSKSLSTATGMTPTRPPPMVSGVASRGPLQAEPTAYQAQRMYPNHPLLQQGPNGAAAWGTAGLNLTGAGVANFNMGLGGTTVAHLPSDVIGSVGNATAPGITLLHPFAGPPMYAPSDTTHLISAAYDLATSLPNLNGSHPVTTFGYELNTKKRACDQCNHSKVRCDFADPCARCNYRHVQCTYTKPPRNARGRNVTYPMPAGMNANLSTSPTRTQSLNQQPTNVFSSPGMVRPQPLANDAAMDRRDSAQSQSSASSDFLRSDGQRVRASGPESQWDGSAYHHPRSHSGSTVSSVGNSSFVAQSPGSGLGLSLTPSLTNETSPSVGSDGPDRRGSQSSMNNNAAWVLPPSLLNHESAVKFVNTFMNGDMSNGLNSANPQFVWPSHHGGLDTSMLPNDALSVTDDESGSTPPDFADGTRPRRRSSAGMWANALKEMHIDDGQGLLDPALADIEFTVPTSFRTPAEGSQTPLDRNLSGSDVNLWKLFLDPGALATPMMFNPETPRLNKSNSAPDLTTPCISHDLANPMENIGQKSEGDADDEETARLKSEKDSPEDKEVRDKWKDHISQRHASFNMNPDAAATVRTRALTNASFASSTSPQRQVRPSLHPLMHVSAGDETLAPERLPSFGPAAFDMNGVLLTPNYRGPMTPSKHFNNVVESRPANKRQASQTLVGDNQKRTTFGLWNDEDDNNTPTDSSRHTSGTAANLAALRSAKIAANASANIPTWQAADASRAC